MKLRLCKYCFITIALFVLSGCGPYRWGNPGLNSLPFHSLYVKPIINETYIPEAQAFLSQQLIRYLQQSGVYITQCEEIADAVLVVRMTQYNQIINTTERTDTTLASSFTVILETRCTLLNNMTQEPYFIDRPVCASINAESNNSVIQVLYQDMPVLTDKVANDIRNLVTGTW